MRVVIVIIDLHAMSKIIIHESLNIKKQQIQHIINIY